MATNEIGSGDRDVWNRFTNNRLASRRSQGIDLRGCLRFMHRAVERSRGRRKPYVDKMVQLVFKAFLMAMGDRYRQVALSRL
jgi:hypothetical protein